METYENALPMRSQGEGANGAVGNCASMTSDSEQRTHGARVIEMPAEDFTAHGGMGFEYGAGRVNAASARRMHVLREEIGDAPLTGIERRWAYRVFKRAFDIVFSAVVLVCFCWLYAVIAILVKADDPKGPVIFSQDRVGRDGKIFRMHKFRSMVADAEERLDELQALNEKTGPVFKIKDDPRVTRVGHWLRKLSLAPVIIGTPGDGEPTKSLSHPENSSLDLQKCERRPGTSLGARHHYTSFQFLSFAVFGGPEGTSGRPLCAFAQAPFACVRTAA